MDKAKLLELASQKLQTKKQELAAMLDDLNEGIANDTKSSAGDKYETSRSMSQQEIDKVSVQLAEVNRQFALLSGLSADAKHSTTQNGSLVSTSAGIFFIGLPLGQIELEGKIVFCISPTAPVAQAMLGKKEKDNYVFAGRTNAILTVG